MPHIDHHLPWDMERCRGVGLDDPAQPGEFWRSDCDTCLRRLAPGHPDPRRTSWATPQPAPCPHCIPADA